jgi:hypothetical protein
MARVLTPKRFVLGWTCQRESRVLAYVLPGIGARRTHVP